LTRPESVDGALCFGWIDGVRAHIDEASYKIRQTPRRAGSIWSAMNIATVEKLAVEGRMTPADTTGFAKRTAKKSAVKSYEQPGEWVLPPAAVEQFRRNCALGPISSPRPRLSQDCDPLGEQSETGRHARSAASPTDRGACCTHATAKTKNRAKS
jgi:hypothetical protein